MDMYGKIKLNLPHLKHDYSIDTLGVIRNETNNKTLKGTSITKKNRYVKIHLDKFYPLHRLVAEHFIPNPENLPQVNHKDGNRLNNTVENLEWVSARENVKHAYKSGLKSNYGELNPYRKLTKKQVREVWSLRNTELTARQIRDKLRLPVSVDAIKKVRSGKNWKSVTSKLS